VRPPPQRIRPLLLSGRVTGVRRVLLLLLLLWPLSGAAQQGGGGTEGHSPLVGPARGTVIAAGGGELEREIWERFVALAGGPEARIVVIPTADAADRFELDWEGLRPLRLAGSPAITLLHTRDRATADHVRFASALREATGVWLPGGRPWRLVDAYLGTLVESELHALLDRGGVLGGTSAGASILGSFLVRGDRSTNEVILASDYAVGFGVLRGAAVDQHLLVRGREDDLWEVLALDPTLLGIGLDEGAALLIQGDLAEVLGGSQVLFYDASGPLPGRHVLSPGERFDLGRRTILSPDQPTTGVDVRATDR